MHSIQLSHFNPAGYCRVCRYEDLYHIHHIAILLTLTVLVPLFIMIGLYCSIAYLIHSHVSVICIPVCYFLQGILPSKMMFRC